MTFPRLVLAALLVLGPVAADARAQAAEPPFTGTAFVTPELITATDLTARKTIGYVGRRNRSIFDRRRSDFVLRQVFEFRVRYFDGHSLLVRVNPEFGSRRRALRPARRYAKVVGQLPVVLRTGLRTVTINAGNADFGGGGRDVVIHTGRTPEYTDLGALEEILLHEASHAVLDVDHADAPGWLAAQDADPAFISTYARDNPAREDVAESFVPYLALRYRRDRIDPSVASRIEQAIPNRIAYFDAQGFDATPLAR